MGTKERIFIITTIVTCFLLQTQGADKYTDGNRPYEFGFEIDGEQHRHEKKDEKGLIEGEFGFITADGVYHVTVYATDEQGRFKILSMKNIRVKPYPTYTAKQSSNPSSSRQGHSLELPTSAQTASVNKPPPVLVTTSTFKPIAIEPPGKSCSHCSIPTTSTPAPVAVFTQPDNSLNQIAANGNPQKFPQSVKPQTTLFGQQGFSGTPESNVPKYPAQTQNNLPGVQTPLSRELLPPQNLQTFQQGFGPAQNQPARAQNPSSGFDSPQENIPGFSKSLQAIPSFPQQPAEIPQSSPIEPQTSTIGRTPKRLDVGPLAGSLGKQQNNLERGLPNGQGAPPTKPTLISAQMQIVDKNTDIYRRGPGEKEGLPDGLTKNDMTKLLYTFNYTVGFHGHFEEGYVNGNKQGYYFVTGRNGVRTRIDYTADSTGFHPRISQEVLDLLSDDVPKAETEKEEKYGLKGYEFKWLYYPVDTKRR